MNDDDKPKQPGLLDMIDEFKHRDPFKKFRIVMTSGTSHTIEHPDLLALGESQIIYCLPRSNRVVYLRHNQIAEVEDTGEEVAAGAVPQDRRND
jgi:hypothetical protein